MKHFITDFLMIAILSVIGFFLLYGIVGFIGMEVLCPIRIITGITWWLICYKQQELMDEIKDLKKEIKELKEKK